MARPPRGTVKLSFSHFLPRHSFLHNHVVKPLADDIQMKSGGEIVVEILAADSAFGDVSRQAQQVEAGRVDMALGLRGADHARFPLTSLIELPFMVNDSVHGSKALWSALEQGLLAQDYAAFKVIALFVHDPGHIHTPALTINVPSDLRDLRLRSPNAAVSAALSKLGAAPALLQVNEVMEALGSGRLDGIVTNWANPLPGFIDQLRFHCELGFYASAFFILMNKGRFHKLSKEHQGVIDSCLGIQLIERIGAAWKAEGERIRTAALDGMGRVFSNAVIDDWRDQLRCLDGEYIFRLRNVEISTAIEICRRFRASDD